METTSLLKTMAAGALCVTTLLFAACDKDNDKPVLNKLNFDKTNVEVTVGQTAELKVKNGTAPFKAVVSGKKGEQVATATVKDRTITVMGVIAGSATLAVTDKNGSKGMVSIMVKKAKGTLTLDKTSVTLTVGKEDKVSIKDGTGPFNALAKDPNIVEPSIKGNEVILMPRKAGTTTVEVTDKDKNLGIISITVK